MSEIEEKPFEHLDELADRCYQNAVNHGFRVEGVDQDYDVDDALIHSELSEVLEALRHGNPPDDKIPEFSGVEAELADACIRILDTWRARYKTQSFIQGSFDSCTPPSFSEFKNDPAFVGKLHKQVATIVTTRGFSKVLVGIKTWANVRGWRLDQAIIAKMKYNEGRPYKHGKEF